MSVSFKTDPFSHVTLGLLGLRPEREEHHMRIGIGLPAAIPGAAGTAIAEWAAAAERHGFASASVIDRLVYDNVEPLVALAAGAACTERIELLTTLLNV